MSLVAVDDVGLQLQGNKWLAQESCLWGHASDMDS